MLKNKLLFPIILSLAVLLAGAGAFAAEAAGANLLDINEHWAQQYIAEMYASEVVTGYTGGLYQPDQSVTRLEVLVMLIRVLGQEDQAKNLAWETVDYYVPPPAWGRGYLIWGVQRGMLDKDLLEQMAGQATRAEVAALVCGALKLSPGSDVPAFEDIDQIAPNYRGLVSAVVDLKIMQGFPGNIFKPNDEITRAQMAVILSRIIENNFAGSEIQFHRYHGNISSFDLTNQLITLKLGDYGYLNKLLAAGCEVFLEGKNARLADLDLGDEVRIILDNNERVVFIKSAAQAVTDKQSYTGRVDSLTYSEGEYRLHLTDFAKQQVEFPVAAAVTITRSGNPKDISAVNQDEFVEVRIAGSKITEISFLDTSRFEGTVTSISSSMLTVRNSDGEKETWQVPGNVVVEGSTEIYDDIVEDSLVKVTVYDDKAIKIGVIESSGLEGEIDSLDTSGTWGITITDDDGDSRKYDVEDDVTVKNNDGDSIDFEDLDTGEWVKLRLNSDGDVDRIEVSDEDNYDLAGTVADLETGSSLWIKIEKSSGSVKRYYISDDATYTRDGSSISLRKIVIGSEVKIRLDNGEVAKIKVTDDQNITLEGEITDINVSSERIRIKQESGNSFSYYLANDAGLEDEDGDDIELEDLEEGWDVEIELEDGKIQSLSRK